MLMQFNHLQMREKGISCFQPAHQESSKNIHRSNNPISYVSDKHANIIALSYRRINSLM